MLKGGSRSPKYSAYMGGKPRRQALCLERRSRHGATPREPPCTPARSCSRVGGIPGGPSAERRAGGPPRDEGGRARERSGRPTGGGGGSGEHTSELPAPSKIPCRLLLC